ncbi:MAG: NYN domain-containing protein [Nanoarchaeota archaeon]|nr:NYN domain-containing protein [Patescibacteria group bacterium]MBU4124637.1 NYN domain-containing protein [Nanoarchaeota archaeon]
MNDQKKKLILKGRGAVYVDWANVYGWKKTLKREVDPEKLFKYFKEYDNISDIYFYFGTDNNEKSQNFLKEMDNLGYKVVTKPVKYIFVTNIEDQKIYRRKCDFDMEVCIDVHQGIKENYDSFIFLTGDGDYEPLYKMLINLGKQVIVIYSKNHLGREIWNMKKGIFKIELKNLLYL